MFLCSADGPARRALGAAGWPVATLFRLRSGAYFARTASASFHFTQPRYFAVWFPPLPQHTGCPRWVEHPPLRWEPPQATHRGAYSQLRCVWPKRWQRLHCSGHFGARYDFTDTRRPQSSVGDRTLDTSGLRIPYLRTNQWRAGRTARILYIRPRFQPEIQYFNIDINRRLNYKNHSRKTAASRQCDQRPAARPRCLVDRAYHPSSEPVAAAAFPTRTSGQSTP